MTFEKAYRIPEDFLEGEKGTRFIKKENLENLVEHNILYFLREENFHVLHDFPTREIYEQRLISSKISTPSEKPLEIKPTGYADETEEHLVKLFVPTSIMPVKFEPVSLIRYETADDHDSVNYIDLMTNIHHKIKFNVMWFKINKIFERLPSKGKTKEGNENRFKGYLNNNIIEFSMRNSVPYPIVKIAVLGREGNPQKFTQNLELDEIGNCFPKYFAKVGMNHSVSSGLAYNLSIEDAELPDIYNLGKDVVSNIIF